MTQLTPDPSRRVVVALLVIAALIGLVVAWMCLTDGGRLL